MTDELTWTASLIPQAWCPNGVPPSALVPLVELGDHLIPPSRDGQEVIERGQELVTNVSLNRMTGGHFLDPSSRAASPDAAQHLLLNGVTDFSRLSPSDDADTACRDPKVSNVHAGGSPLPDPRFITQFSALASLAGMDLCSAVAAAAVGSIAPATNGNVSSNFGKISPVYGNGATGSRGGTPDIPQPSNLCTNGTKTNGLHNLSITPSIMSNNHGNKYINIPNHMPRSSCSPDGNAKMSVVTSSVDCPKIGNGNHVSSVHLVAIPPSIGVIVGTNNNNSNPNNHCNNSERQTYSCELCGKPFGQPYNLRRHMSTHTGSRPFRCPYCEYAASQNVHLDKHIRRIHPNIANGGRPPAHNNFNSPNGTSPLSVAANGSYLHQTSNGNNGITINGSGLPMNVGGGATNGVLKVDPGNHISPKAVVNSPWKFEPAAVTP